MKVFYRPLIRKHPQLDIWYHSWQASTRQLQTLRPLPQGAHRGQPLGNFLFFSFIKSFVFEQQELFGAYFLFVFSDLRAHDPGWGRAQNLGHL